MRGPATSLRSSAHVPSWKPPPQAAAERFPETVPAPPFWGGYRVVPDTVEFWQGGPARLHDRLRYTRSGAQWRLERLAP